MTSTTPMMSSATLPAMSAPPRIMAAAIRAATTIHGAVGVWRAWVLTVASDHEGLPVPEGPEAKQATGCHSAYQ
ncbi:MAG: hypothetical protein AUG49_14475 [Catenulispora sp. 13_1_20CM_3_70_7]|nr:MAG: hypothetical protein AUG49_14475 [Catenulispora sp. 13_1_20CM_3_70_7]